MHRVTFNRIGLLGGLCRPQFGLRALLLATTVAAICAMVLRRAREQQAAVRLIRDYGGSVAYDFQERPPGSGNFDRDACADLPAWLVKSLGDDFLADVVLAEIERDTSSQVNRILPRNSPESVALRLSAFPRLRYLFFWGNIEATDRMLEVVGGLTDLEILDVDNAGAVTDGGVRHLTRLHKLWSFGVLNAPSITDDSLRTLASLRSLQHIGVGGSHITDRGIMYLRGMPGLKTLRLSGSDVEMGDDAVSWLGTLTALEELDVSDARVTSRAFESLEPLPNLRVLNLSGNTGFGDDGMVALGRLTSLEELNLNGTNVTAKGMRHLAPLKKLRSLKPEKRPEKPSQ
jgi:hypothetical protein